MNIASVLSMAFAVAALCAAAFHGWLHMLRRQERTNLWLAVTAIGVGGGGIATALLYESHDVLRSDLLQRGMLASTALFVVGFAHFSFHYLGVERPAAARAIAFFCGAMALIALWPGLAFDREPIVRHIDLLDVRYAESGLSGLGRLIALSFVPVCLYVLRVYATQLAATNPHRPMLAVMLAVWVAVCMNDACIGLGVYRGPILMSVGHGLLLLGFSLLQVRHLLDSLDTGERSADQLAELVDRRTAELRETELQLAHGEQMATIGTLAAGLAHEINNPIAYVRSNLNRIDETWGEEDEELDEMLAECQQGIERIRTICWSLLTLARRSDGVDEPVDLGVLIDSTLPVVRREAEPRAAIETDVDDDIRVAGDPRLLGHVILSLMMNALRTIPKGAPAENRVRISTRREQADVVLSVSDTGSGIPGERLDQVFEPILSPRDGQEGSGLGLVVAKQIIERHQGDIRVDSDGDGTTVTVRLPAI